MTLRVLFTMAFLNSFFLCDNAYAQELDIFGRAMFSFGAPFSPLARFYNEQNIDHRVYADSINDIKDLVDTDLFIYKPYDPRELLAATKTFTFYNESLVEISIIVTEPDGLITLPRKKKPAKLYESTKQGLSQLYNHTPTNKPVFSDVEDRFIVCQWDLDSTIITLARLNEIIFLQYSMKKMPPEVKKALNSRPNYLNLPESASRYLLPFLLKSTTPTSK